jgi:23S rRNA maturation mini-RNase III
LRNLFDQKLYFFNLPFINELTDEEKSSIRRAPNATLLHIAAAASIISYTQRTGKTLIDIFDQIEDAEFETLNNSTTEETKTE